MTNVNMSIDEAIESGDPELISAALERVTLGEQGETEVTANVDATATETTPEATAPAKSDESSAPQSAAAGDDLGEAAGVQAQDGRHVIPFDVLKKARDKAAVMAEKAAALEAENAALKAKLEAGSQVDEEAMLDTLNEFHPQLGEKFKQLNDDVKNLRARVPGDTAEEVEARLAFRANPDLVSWHASDPEKFAAATYYDDMLDGDPKWAGATKAERFAEAVRLTKLEFAAVTQETTAATGAADAIAKAQKIVAEKSAAPAVPRSLSDVGATPQSAQLPMAKRVLDMTPDQIQSYLDTLSGSALDDFLRQVAEADV